MQINRQSYEEYFLLYADGELNESEQRAVEEFIDQNPDLAGELSILQETVFKPDGSIVFDNKELLYKEESEERKVIYLRWFRMAAAAAVLIAFSVAGWMFFGNRDIPNVPVAVIEKPEVKKAAPAEVVSSRDAGTEPVQQQSATHKTISQPDIPLIAHKAKSEEDKTDNRITNIATEPDLVDVVPPSKRIEGAAFTKNVVPSEPAKETIDVAVEPRAMNNNNGNQHANDVSYAQSFRQESDDDDMIYFANTSLTKKTKLRGVLRKATRYLDRVTSLQ